MNKKISFWQLLEKHSVKIPLIQRDYAQGRLDSRSKEIREGFVGALKVALRDGSDLDLDFIYGSDISQDLVILDGQQRLTTLFLLHAYLAHMTGAISEIPIAAKLSKFSYETRDSSSQFCKEFIKNPITDIPEKVKFSEEVQDSPWFFLSWKKDPTVKAMLVTLDTIHGQFTDADSPVIDFSLAWERLCNDSLITFQFLNMPEFGLTDELYIKMNARGKALTHFENFKAWLEDYVKKNEFALDASWENKFDQDWTDLFWEERKEGTYEIDDERMSFFRSYALSQYAEKRETCEAKSPEAQWISKMNDLKKDEYFAFTEFVQRSCFGEKEIKESFKVLDYLYENKQARQDFWSYLVNPTSLIDRARAYALQSYVRYAKEDSDIAYGQWIRLSLNFVNNTIFNAPNDFVKTVQSLDKLAKHCFSDSERSVYELFSQLENSEIKYFRLEQRDEELEKVKLILNSELNWETHIKEFENHEYFSGQVAFLLRMSADEADTYSLDRFVDYGRKASVLFGELLNHDELLLERALLSQGDYLIRETSYFIRKNFCVASNQSGKEKSDRTARERYENWRKIFNDPERLSMLKRLLDEVALGEEEKSLRELITSYDLTDWRSFFIEDENKIKVCGQRYIYQLADCERIYLLAKKQMNGAHAELLRFKWS